MHPFSVRCAIRPPSRVYRGNSDAVVAICSFTVCRAFCVCVCIRNTKKQSIMGASGSKGGRAAGAAAIDEKLAHLRSHVADSMVTHGLIQEITVMINKNANGERERFCHLLYAASADAATLRASSVGSASGGSVVDSSSTAAAVAAALASSGNNAAGGASILDSSNAAAAAGASFSVNSGGGGGDGFQPFAELFSRVHLMTDAASRTSVVHWLRHVTDANELEWTPILVKNNVVSFVTDFYQFQANTHVPPDTLTNMSQLLARWSVYDCFADAMSAVDAFRGVLVRLRFAQSNSKERSYLLSAMRRCHHNNVSRNDSMEILMKIALERDENVEQTHVDSLEMLADALLQRLELLQSFTMKHIASFQRFFSSSNALVASAMRLFVTIIEVEERLQQLATASAVASSTTSPTSSQPPAALPQGSPMSGQQPQVTASASAAAAAASSPLRKEIVKTLCSSFDISLIDNPFAVPLYLVATSSLCIAELGKDAALTFVDQKNFQLMLKKIYKNVLEVSDLPRRFALLILLLLRVTEKAPSMATKIANGGALHLLLDCIAVVPDEQSMEVVVAAASELCQTDPAVGLALCSDHKLHTLMQSINASKSAEETLVVVWGIVRLLEAVLTPQVLHTADEMLIMAVYSLLCQILGSCTVPPKRFFSTTKMKSMKDLKTPTSATTKDASAPPQSPSTLTRTGSTVALLPPVAQDRKTTVTEKIVQSALQMLTDRCNLGPAYAESILGQVPLGIIRVLVSADHLPLLSEMAKKLVAVMANASIAAMSELSIFGCMADRLDPKRQKKAGHVTLRRFQRHWKRILHVRRISENRVRMANLLKDTFMCRLNVAHHETDEFNAINDSWRGNLARIQHDYDERDQLIEMHERQTEVLRRTEGNARTLIALQMCDDAEQRFRLRMRVEEQQIRLHLGPQRTLCGEETATRVEITKEADGIIDAQLKIHRSRVQELQLRLVKRTAVIDAEAFSRNALIQQLQVEFNKLVLYQCVMHLSEEERLDRKQLSSLLLAQHVDFLKESFVILLQQTQEDEIRLRGAIETSREREHYWLSSFYVQTEVLQGESYRRIEWQNVETGTRASLTTKFLNLTIQQLQLDESKARAKLSRNIVLDWRLAWLPYDRFNVIANEEIRRRALINDHRLGTNFMHEASRYMKPIVCQAEELRRRQEIDLEYATFAQAQKWELAFCRLVRDELAARNAVALQYYHMARNMLVPLVCIRLVDYQHRLLCADLVIRTDIAVEERDEFYYLLLAEVRDMQKLFRTFIAREQAVDHERLAQHFVTVTHVVRLQEQAQNTLTEYSMQKRAMELHGGFQKVAPKKSTRSLVAKVKALNATV